MLPDTNSDDDDDDDKNYGTRCLGRVGMIFLSLTIFLSLIFLCFFRNDFYRAACDGFIL